MYRTPAESYRRCGITGRLLLWRVIEFVKVTKGTDGKIKGDQPNHDCCQDAERAAVLAAAQFARSSCG
jgi:hypothetical protein